MIHVRPRRCRAEGLRVAILVRLAAPAAVAQSTWEHGFECRTIVYDP